MSENSMKSSENSLKTIKFGDFRFDCRSGVLFERGEPVTLRPRARDAFRLLAASQGRTVSYDELRSALWGATHLEWRDGVHHVMRDVRKALGENARNPRFIETVRGVGYRFNKNADCRPLFKQLQSFDLRTRDVMVYCGGLLSLPGLIIVTCVFVGLT